ncbi:WD repeat protein Lub1 [Sorochytrium milnesiophthora]
MAATADADQYKLSAVLLGHEEDVKAVCFASDDVLVSASRDKTVRSWVRSAPGSNQFEQRHVFAAHSAFVNSVVVLPPTPEHPNGLVASGGTDKVIYVHDLDKPQEPLYVLSGHENNVCALAALPGGGGLVSGSWDKTARVWVNGACVQQLKGHESAVWSVLAIDSDRILTASADKTVKLWQGGKCVQTFAGHRDVVRHLALSDMGIVSCSNDSTVRIWSQSGDCLQEMHGHTSFVYQVVVLPTSGQLASCGEDRSLRIWKDDALYQTIMLPSTSAWTLSAAPCGDIAVGSSDGVVRVFSRAADKVADAETLQTFNAALADFAIPKGQVGDVNKEKLPGLEALASPGKKEGQVIMIRNENVVEAHQWSAGDRQWIKVGEVVDAVGSGRKQVYEGVEYDYVFDIDVGDDLPHLKLPFNVTENPYAAAQRFLNRHELPPSYLDEVANFIVKNTQGVSLGVGSSEYQDPFTGGSRYRGSTSSTATAAYTSGGDPFTGQNRYAPKPAATSTTPAFTVPEYVTFQQANVAAIVNKLQQLQSQTEQKADIGQCEALANKLGGGGGNVSTAEHDALIHLLQTWPVASRFPGLDLLRLAVLVSPAFIGDIEQGLVAKASGFDDQTQVDANVLLTLRLYANMFKQQQYRDIVWKQRSKVLGHLSQFKEAANKNIALGVATVLLNFSILLSAQPDEDFAIELLAMTVETLRCLRDAESLFRAVTALGVLLGKMQTLVDVARTLETSAMLKDVQAREQDPRVQQTIAQVMKML